MHADIRSEQAKLRLLMNKYDLAQEVISSISSTKYRQYEILRKDLTLYQFYIDLLYGNLERINLKSIKTHLNTFSKDLSGKYISLLIGELIYYISTGREGKIIDKSEALNMYIRNHLSEENNKISYTFIRNLLLLLRNKDLEPLPKVNIQQDDVEIIPYETLQAVVLDRLVKSGYIMPQQ